LGDYRSLKVWQRAHALTLEVYRATAGYPSSELYGLTSQTRRSAASIGCNLAEGCGRNTDRELKYFCRVALGSANELEYQLLLGHDLGHLPAPEFEILSGQADQLKRMLTGLSGRLQAH
jgi:four helix bundle protein